MPSDDVVLNYFSDLDRHFGHFMEKLSGGNSPALFLAAALASRSSREGHICLELTGFAGRRLLPEGADLGEEKTCREMPDYPSAVCPDLSTWEEILRNCSVVGRPGEYKPLILDEKSRLYLYRYWFYEDTLIQFIKGCLNSPGSEGSEYIPDSNGQGSGQRTLREYLHHLFPEDLPTDCSDIDEPERLPDRQKLAALAALQRRFLVISGSPGTGKTTTAARIIAMMQQLHRGKKFRIALTAPTGKAAIRLEEAMGKAFSELDPDSQPGKAMTLHRLLGVIPGSSYFRHSRSKPLPYDLVVVDEASMVDLPLMAKLVMALPSTSRLILLGDRDQLASVEAGAALGDLCGPPDELKSFSHSFFEAIWKLTGEPFALPEASGHVPAIRDSIIQLQKNYRFRKSSGIGQFSNAINKGEINRAFSILKSSHFADIDWQPLPEPQSLTSAFKKYVMSYFKEYLHQVGITDNFDAIFETFERFRILCALRQGPFGVLAINALLENLLRSERLISGEGKWYPGRPIMITRNDYSLGLFNGDVGLTLPDRNGDRLSVFFPDSEKGVRRIAPFRLPDHETVYAMTVHKSQGSEFNKILLILSDRDAPLLTRELIYTGVTRAKQQLYLWGREEILSRAISRRITRTSGLRDALWGTGTNPCPG